jgi:hypothetical protein
LGAVTLARLFENRKYGGPLSGSFPQRRASHDDFGLNQPEIMNVIDSRNLARFPIRWNHLIEKNSRQFKNLEHVLVGKAGPLFRDMLWRGICG